VGASDRVLGGRHSFTHNDGLVDQKFLNKVPTSPLRLGQRLTITEDRCRQAIDDAAFLCEAVSRLTAP
jgi:hypothetical protein